MRVSGNYLERHLYSTFPIVLLGSMIMYIFQKNWIASFFGILLIWTTVFFIDKIPLRKTRLSSVHLLNDKLFVDKLPIDINEIILIRPFKTSPPQSLLILELYLKDNSCIRFMDRSKFFFHKTDNNLNSRSLYIIFNKFPKLKTKLRAQKNYTC